jgi:hypothetical protein
MSNKIVKDGNIHVSLKDNLLTNVQKAYCSDKEELIKACEAVKIPPWGIYFEAKHGVWAINLSYYKAKKWMSMFSGVKYEKSKV